MTVREEALKFLKNNPNERFSAREVANAIGRNVDYTRKKLNNLTEDVDSVKKVNSGPVILTEIEDETVVLVSDRDILEDIVEEHAPSKLKRAKKMGSTDAIRRMIRREIADGSFPAGQTNDYFYKK